MCGIAGAIDLKGRREFPAARLLAMTGAIAHRGPDDEQIHIEPGVALGARRLSIVDLAGGRQPIANEDGSIWVAFNGELFEYPELRQELLARGHRLATRCDTEAWVHLYEDLRRGDVREGPRPVRRLALGPQQPDADPRPRPGRDLPALLRRGRRLAALGLGDQGAAGLGAGRRAGPTRRGSTIFFTFFCAGTTRTFFEGIKSLPPGHFLRVQDGRVELKQVLGPRLPRRRRRAPARRPDAAGRRARGPAAAGGRAPAAGRRAGRQLHQRRARLDGRPRALQPRSAASAVPSFTIGLDKAGPDERSHADRGGRGARLAADDGHDGPRRHRRRPIPS